MGISGSSTVSADDASAYDLRDPGLVSCLVLLRRDPQFAELTAAWETLPAAIRSAIMAVLRTRDSDS